MFPLLIELAQNYFISYSSPYDSVQKGVFMLHVRYEGRFFEIKERELELPKVFDDITLKEALAYWYGFDLSRLASYEVERRDKGHIHIRPRARCG